MPARLTSKERDRIRKSGVFVRVAIEPTGPGVYKSIAYEIFKRRPSVLLALDGNSAAANLVQEAKNAAVKSAIFVNARSGVLREKAEMLEGYVTAFSGGEAIADRIMEAADKQESVRR